MGADEGHETFVMPINYDGVRKQFQRDMEIYGGVMVRQIKRSGPYAEQVINPDDLHGFVAGLNVALSCVGDGDALNELRTLFDKIVGEIAEANRNRKNDDIVCPACGSIDCVETHPGEFACETCDHEWENDDDDDE